MAALPDVTNPPAQHGKNSRLFISTSRAGALKQVALLSEWTIDMSSDKVETTALSDTNKTYVKGLKDLKGTLSGFWDDTDDALFAAADSEDGIMMAIYPKNDDGTYWAGPAWLDASIKGGVTAAVAVDGTFSANGSWSHQFTAVP